MNSEQFAVDNEVSSFSSTVAPLEGMRILELSTYVAGPSCGLTLAQLGAEVIRVDPVGGASDIHRLPLDVNGDSLYWAGLNNAKRSIEIDTLATAGREIVYRLLGDAGDVGGILVTNSVAQDWLKFDNLIAHRSDLIEVHITGRADGKPAVDYTVNCEVGLPLITGPSDLSRPVNHVLPAWDLLTGLHAAVGILSAERVRSRSGVGQLISVALADVAVATMGHLGYLSDVALNGHGRVRDGNYLYGSFGCDFQSKDGRGVMIVALTGRQWRNLLNMTGIEHIIESLEQAIGVDLTAEEDRYHFREVLVGLIRPWFDARNYEEIATALDANRVLWGPYRTLEELVGEPDSLLNVSPIMDLVERAGAGTYPSPRSVLQFREWDGRATQPPRLGQDTRTVLTELLGMSPNEVSRLQEDGIVGGSER